MQVSRALAVVLLCATSLVPLLVSAKSKEIDCFISDRKVSKDNARINCVYKCADGSKEAEVIPKGNSCPSKISVTR
jgi:hypothetical protein